MRDPTNPSRRVHIPARLRKGRVASIKILSITSSPLDTDSFVNSLSPDDDQPSSSNNAIQHLCNTTTAPRPLLPLPPADSFAYKKVANKVRPVAATLPKNFRNIRRIPVDPLLSLTPLPTHLPNFTPGERLTQERLDALSLNADGFLQPEEEKLLLYVLKANEMGLAWMEEEKGRFSDEYFSPVKIPVIEHIP